MNKTIKIIIILLIFFGLFFVAGKFYKSRTNNASDETCNESKSQTMPNGTDAPQEEIENKETDLPTIEALRQKEYPGGDFVIEEALPNGTNYRQSIVSYRSEDLKIYGLLTVPLAEKPEKGYPAVVFVHGHIPPKQYSTTGSYPSYQAALARGGFVTFKPDLRGHGRSEGEATSAHFSQDYVVDAQYAISYLKKYKDVDPERLGYWGHSNGGETGLRTAVINSDIKAYVFWAGVVGSFEDMLETYNAKIPFLRNAKDNSLVQKHKLPSENPEFWKKIDPYSYLNDISASIALHHGTNDSSVPIELSLRLKEELEKSGKKVEYFEYAGDDHNIGKNSGIAWQRTISFFKENL